MRSRMLAAGAVLAGLLGGCLHRPPPSAPAPPSGRLADVGPRLNNWSQATIPADGSIVVTGDAFVGPGVEPRPKRIPKGGPTGFADALVKATGVKVEDEMRPGSTLAEGLDRYADGPAGNLVVICYGYGDAATETKGGFRRDLQSLIAAAQARGAAVFVMVEPVTKAKLSTAAELFRKAERDLAAANGAGLIDAPAALAKAATPPNPGGAPTAAELTLMAGQVAQYVKLAPAG